MDFWKEFSVCFPRVRYCSSAWLISLCRSGHFCNKKVQRRNMKSRQVIVYSRSVSNGKFVSEKIAASHLKMGVMAQMPTYRWLRLQLTKPFLFYRLASTLPRQNGTCLTSTSSTAGPYSLQLAQIMYTLRKIWLRNFFRFLRSIKCLTDIFFVILSHAKKITCGKAQNSFKVSTS